MRAQSLLLVANYLLILIGTLVALGVQCSLWFQTLGSTPPPYLWLPILVYVSLYRYQFETLCTTYLISATMAGFSIFPFGLALLSNLVLALSIQSFKQRIYWNGAGFFAMVVGATSVFHPILMLILSWAFDKNPIRQMSLVTPLVSSLLTTLFSFPMYRVMTRFDRWTQKDLPTEIGPQFL